MGLGLAACDLNPAEPLPAQESPHIIVSAAPAVSPSPAQLAVWVLWPLSVNVHQSPATSAPVAGTAAQTTELDVDGSRVVDGKTWLQVHATDESGLKGWVLDDPGLVIHQAINLQINSDQSWSMVFPVNWTVTPGSGPTGVTTVTGDQQTMTVDVESPSYAFKAPGNWTFVKDQQIEVYGKTSVLATFSTATTYEFVTNVQWDTSRRFVIRYTQPRGAAPDASLCLQLITGIKVD